MSAEFIHRYVPGTRGETLLLLHGTGADEQSLLPLGAALLPGANLLSPRGQVLEGRMPRFFRRLAEGVFDVPDLIARTGDLAEFVTQAAAQYHFDPARVTAAGFSNGANIAASLLLLHPTVLARAVLLRAMVPLEPNPLPTLPRTPVWLGGGRHDPIIPPDNTLRLAKLLERAGAQVHLDWRDVGHQLAPGEIEDIAGWLE